MRAPKIIRATEGFSAGLPGFERTWLALNSAQKVIEPAERKKRYDAAQKILQMGPRYLIIKKGEHGALLFNKEQVFFAPALPLEDVFDPTGAGDTFAGGFIGHIAQTRDISFDNMKRAIIFGSAMASFCVEKFGLERMIGLTQAEIDERVQQFIDLVQFDIELV